MSAVRPARPCPQGRDTRRSSARRAAGASQGASLFELLVALAVGSIGLLGSIGLVTQGVQGTQNAQYRTAATIAAGNVADAIRATFDDASGPPGYFNPLASTATAACRGTAGCSPQEMAEDSLFLATQAIGTQMPGGAIWVCRDDSTIGADLGTPTAPACSGGAGDPIVVKVWWTVDGGVEGVATEVRP